MNITFTKDFCGFESGHSAYKAGEKATLRHGQRLIDLGVAREGWQDETVTLEFKPIEETSLSELKKIAKSEGIKGYARMKRKTLIERLTDGS